MYRECFAEAPTSPCQASLQHPGLLNLDLTSEPAAIVNYNFQIACQAQRGSNFKSGRRALHGMVDRQLFLNCFSNVFPQCLEVGTGEPVPALPHHLQMCILHIQNTHPLALATTHYGEASETRVSKRLVHPVTLLSKSAWLSLHSFKMAFVHVLLWRIS